jgi:transcription termination/antitermination protein NusG
MTAQDSISQDRWYALSVRYRHERIGAAMLESVGVTTFLPLLMEMHQWSDRQKSVMVPLFPSYMFVQVPPTVASFTRVLQTPGVLNFVGSRNMPTPIPEKEIADIRCVLSHKVECSPCSFLKLGQRVRVVGGALNQVEGTLVGRGPDSKLVVSIELIQRSLAITLYDFDVEPIFDTPVLQRPNVSVTTHHA